MCLERGLDLFGKTFTATVDRHRSATEHRDRAVFLQRREIAGQRVAHTVVFDESPADFSGSLW